MIEDEGRSKRATLDNLEGALSTIDEVAATLDIDSKARGTATMLYRQTLENRSTLFGWDIDTAACACLYLACKIEHEGVSPNDIAAVGEGVRKKLLLRRAKTLRNELGLQYVDIVDPIQYVEEYLEDLDASNQLRTRALEIIEKIQDTPVISGVNPRSSAAAAIYNAGIDVGEKITQAEIAEIADVTEVTIRNRYQEQRELL